MFHFNENIQSKLWFRLTNQLHKITLLKSWLVYLGHHSSQKFFFLFRVLLLLLSLSNYILSVRFNLNHVHFVCKSKWILCFKGKVLIPRQFSFHFSNLLNFYFHKWLKFFSWFHSLHTLNHLNYHQNFGINFHQIEQRLVPVWILIVFDHSLPLSYPLHLF